jgi:DNA-binding CsgD family transcriptional regulator
MRRESAEALLAVRPEDCTMADGALIDATGTRRRVQALVAMGWSFTALGPEFDMHPRPLSDIARAERVTVATARKVKTAYKRLIHFTPEQCGVHSQARALAKRVAAREGWVLPGAWDDIDDPACTPDRGPEDPANRTALAALRQTEIKHLASAGIPEHEIADRLGMARTYVHDLIRDMSKAA